MEYGQVMAFMLCMARVTSFLYMIPFLKNKYIPNMAKIALACAISLASMKEIQVNVSYDLLPFAGEMIIQAFIGTTLAYVIEVIFSVARMAGGMIDTDLGFTMAQMLDPSSNQQSSLFANLFTTFFMLLFVTFGGLGVLIQGIVSSFKITNVHVVVDKGFIEYTLTVIQYLFNQALEIAIPVMCSMFIVNFVGLIIGKASPQANIFQNIFILRIILGVFLIYLFIPYIGHIFIQMQQAITDNFSETLDNLLKKG